MRRLSASKGDTVKKSTLRLVVKLSLNRETLRVLEQSLLGNVAGGEDPSVTVRYSNCGSCNTGEPTGVGC
jgi:hypothetical protein